MAAGERPRRECQGAKVPWSGQGEQADSLHDGANGQQLGWRPALGEAGG
jgi:hypothetical protein